MKINKNIEFDLLATSEKLMKTRIITRPDYRSWLARKQWSAFEAVRKKTGEITGIRSPSPSRL